MKEEKNPLDNTDDYKKIENVITQSENKKYEKYYKKI